MADYKRGSMDVSFNQKCFDGFVKFSMWTCIVVIFVLLFLAVFNS